MTEDHMKQRCISMHMPRKIRQKIRELLNVPDHDLIPEEASQLQKYLSSFDRKHLTFCMKRKKTILYDRFII